MDQHCWCAIPPCTQYSNTHVHPALPTLMYTLMYAISATEIQHCRYSAVSTEEKEKPPPSLRPQPSPPSPHKCPPFHPCSKRECKLRIERQRAKEALHKTCTNCDVDLYITMCCAEEKELCEDCCNDLGVCSRGVPSHKLWSVHASSKADMHVTFLSVNKVQTCVMSHKLS